LKENSNRSLFKISEESIAQLNLNNQNLKKESKSQKLKRVEDTINNTKLIHNKRMIKQSSSVIGIDDYKKEITLLNTNNNPIIQSSSSMSSLNCKNNLKKDNSVNNNNNNNKLKENKTVNNNNNSKIQIFSQIRRAQSDITFDLFEKLIKKHRLKSTVKDECESDDDDILLPNKGIYDQYYEEVDNQLNNNNNNNTTTNKLQKSNFKQKSDWTIKLQLKYKADSKSLDEKINRCFSLKSESTGIVNLLTGAKSFHNLMFNDFSNSSSINYIKNNTTPSNTNNNINNNESSFSLISSTNDRISSNRLTSGFLSLSQQLKYKDLKQFKTTLECVELLSKKKFSNKKSNLNIDDETIDIEELRNKLFQSSLLLKNNARKKQLKTESCAMRIMLTREEKEEYEKQGAIPKQRINTASNYKSKAKQKRLTSKKIRTYSSSSSLTSSSSSLAESISSIDSIKINSKKLRNNEKSKTSGNNNYNLSSIMWSGGSTNMQSPNLLNSRNLTTSASQAASAAVKLIRRDFFDRFTNRNTTTSSNTIKKNDDIDIDLPMTSSSLIKNEIPSEMINVNDYDEINDGLDQNLNNNKPILMNSISSNNNKNNENDDYYEEIDDNFYSNKNNTNNIKSRRRSSNDLIDQCNRSNKQTPTIRPKASINRNRPETKQNNTSLSPYQFNSRRIQLHNNNNNSNNNPLPPANTFVKPIMLGDKSLPILLKKTQINSNSAAKHTPKQNRNQYSVVGRTYEEIMQISNIDSADQLIDKKDETSTNNNNNNNHYRLITLNNNSGMSSKHNRQQTNNNNTRRSRNSSMNPQQSTGLIRANSNTLSTNLGIGRLIGNRYESRSNRHQYHNNNSRRQDHNNMNISENNLFSLNELMNTSNDNNNNNNNSSNNNNNDIDRIDAIVSADTNLDYEENEQEEEEEIKKKVYKLWLTKSISFNIPFNHYSLLAMMDKNKTIAEFCFTILVSVLVAIFASLILSQQIYDDILMLIFCFIVASCHYSLLKSVQPDSASPIHGFNSLTALSRPIYFCLICSLVLALRFCINNATSIDSLLDSLSKFNLYGFCFTTDAHLKLVLTVCETFLLFLPVIFTLGLFPQINTFTICILEQMDMYLFGGTALTNLPGGILSVLRSISTCLCLSSVLFASIYTIPIINNNNDNNIIYQTSLFSNKTSKQISVVHLAASQNQFSQSVVFSVFCGLLVLVSYLLSRQSSDLLIYFSILKQYFKELKKTDNNDNNNNKNSKKTSTMSILDEPLNTPLLSETNEILSMKKLVDKQQKQHESTSIDSCHPSSPPSSFDSSTSTPSSSVNNSPLFPVVLATTTNTTSNQVTTSTGAKKEEEIVEHEKEEEEETKQSEEVSNESIDYNQDPLEKKLKKTVKQRLESDILVSLFIFLFVFAIHVSTVFSSLKPVLNDILFCLAILIGALNHYFIPHLRVENPWHLFSQPLLKPDHWSMFEPTALAHLKWFESIHVMLMFIEKNVLNILVILSAITLSSDSILLKFEHLDTNGFLACFVISCVSMKLLRHSFCEPAKQYQIFIIAYLFNKFDSAHTETILFDLFFVSICLSKLIDLIDKLSFIFVYTAPWQLPWGSAFHAFAQPLSVPHSALLILQACLASLFGSPLMPLMGSAIFMISYMRPVKFWEKNYKTKRLDNSNTRLQSQFESTTTDSENLNAIFYEHLTSVLQNSLCGDIMLGRWGQVNYGDFFVLSSDYLNCLVHIIECGNGFVTFQLRGLEFKGTYCQQRELEAITEDNTENEGCCCCSLGHLKYMLSFNVSFHLRWVAWSVIAKSVIVDAYRIVDNDLSLIVNFFSLRRTLIDFYIKSSIFYLIRSPKLIEWLRNENISKELEKFTENYIDYDVCFDSNMDVDFDFQQKGVTLAKFSNNFLKWINHCKHQNLNRIKKNLKSKKNANLLESCLNDSSSSVLVRFCFALSLVCRRALNTACTGASYSTGGRKSSFGADFINATTNATSNTSPLANNNSNNNNNNNNNNNMHNTHLDSDSLASFQHGYYTLFKGDIRIQSPKDEWVFNDMEILKQIVIPAVRMGLRLHQDHFQNDSNDETSLYENLTKFDSESVISYERDPIWRYAVLNSVQSLLSLRHQFTEYSDQYKVVMLNKNFLSFRLIKLNKECVRSFWAGQQHELIFLRNKNQERGSIQNAKQVLRNIINSSCDQPIGYPIYVSPLTTSYSSTHPQIRKIIGPEFKFKNVYNSLMTFFTNLRQNCTNNCTGSSNENNLFQCDNRQQQQQQQPQPQQNLNITYTTRSDTCQINMNRNFLF